MALEAADLGVWEFDPVAKTFTADHHFWRMLGDEHERFTRATATLAKQYPPDDLEQMLQALDAHLQGNTEAYLAEYRIRHGMGHWIWVSGAGKVMLRDPQGQPLRAIGTIRDISTRKRQSEQGMDLLQQIKSLIQDMGQSPAQSAQPGSARTATGNAAELDQLTRRQRQLLELIARGWTSAQIAAELNISTATAVSHRRDLDAQARCTTADDALCDPAWAGARRGRDTPCFTRRTPFAVV